MLGGEMSLMKGQKRRIICDLFGIQLPIIQAGMVWVSGSKLAAASSNQGVLGLIGAASMSPELLHKAISQVKGVVQVDRRDDSQESDLEA